MRSLSRPAVQRVQRGVLTLVLILGGVPIALPLVWLALSSLKTADGVLTDRPEWLPAVDTYTLAADGASQPVALVTRGWGDVSGVWRIRPAGSEREPRVFFRPAGEVQVRAVNGYVAPLGLLKRAVSAPQPADEPGMVRVGQLGTQRRVAVAPDRLDVEEEVRTTLYLLGRNVAVELVGGAEETGGTPVPPGSETGGTPVPPTAPPAVPATGFPTRAGVRVSAPSEPFLVAAARVDASAGPPRIGVPALGGAALPVEVLDRYVAAGVWRVRFTPGIPVAADLCGVRPQRQLLTHYFLELDGRRREVKPTRYDAAGRPVEVALLDEPRTWTVPAEAVTEVTHREHAITWLGQPLTVRLRTDVAAPPGCVALEPTAPHDSVAVALGRVAHARRLDPQWSNYLKVFQVEPLHAYVLNTLFITALSIVGNVLSCGLVGYAFARLRFRGRGPLFLILLSTMMLPSTITFLPTYILYVKIGWLDTFYPLIVPTFLATSAFFVFLYRQFFLTIPLDVEDAARMDGCGPLATFWHILLPMARPAVVTVTVFTFMAAWNDFMGPLLYINTDEYQTLAYGLYSFKTGFGYKFPNYMMAASTMMMIPVLIIFFLAQKAFLRGVVVTGVKG